MYTIDLKDNSEIRSVTEQKNGFSILEYQKDISVSPEGAVVSYYASEMNVRKKQLIIELHNGSISVQAGAMQMTVGDISIKSDIGSVRDFTRKLIASIKTGETLAHPSYEGTGTVILEPTYKHILLEDLADWDGGMIIEDGMFLASESTVTQTIRKLSKIGKAFIGKEGLYHNELSGKGIVALESNTPRPELITVTLDNDVLKIDGNNAVAWSAGLDFTIEKATGKIGESITTGEAYLNVYRGTGKVLIATVR